MVATTEKVETIVGELEHICNLYGGFLSPSAVVAWAQENPNSGLHDRFEWDDAKAGDEYRLWQAREVIASVRVIVEGGDKQESVRAYVSLYGDRQSDAGYRLLVDVLTDADSRGALLRQIGAELNRVLRKYNQLKELAGIQAEVDKLIELNNHDVP